MKAVRKTIKKISIKKVIGFFLLFLGFFIFSISNWVIVNFGVLSIDQYIFHLAVPLEGTDTSVIISALVNSLIKTSILMVLFHLLILNYTKYQTKLELMIRKKKFTINLFPIFPKILNKRNYFKLSIALFFIPLIVSIYRFGVFEYIYNMRQTSTVFEEFYVDPREVEITFPEESRNLIIIYLESMESTFFSKEHGGSFYNHYIPNLFNIAYDNINFSHNDGIGGFHMAPGTQWTTAGIFASMSGLPLLVPIDGNTLGRFEEFMPAATTLGTLLEEQGYNQTFMIGSDARFGGRDSMLTQHGNFEIIDYFSAIERGWIDEDYWVFWGYEDRKLLENSKEILLEKASLEDPFAFVILTVDTHFPDGFLDDECEEPFYEPYGNALFCSDDMIYQYLNWIKEQDFFENTTIVLMGDHFSFDTRFVSLITPGYERRIYNAFINSVTQPVNKRNRNFNMMDMFPSILASMGIEIEGNRLGIGTNLFSSVPTVTEVLGDEKIHQQLRYRSEFYNNKFIFSR